MAYCDKHDEMVGGMNDIRWLKKIGWAVLVISSGLLVLGITTIYGAGALSQRVERNTKDADTMMQETRELHLIFQQHILSNDHAAATEELMERRKEFEKKTPPIYATVGGEEA